MPWNRLEEVRRDFWERVFLGKVEYYRAHNWDASSSACAAKDADEALAEWDRRWTSSGQAVAS